MTSITSHATVHSATSVSRRVLSVMGVIIACLAALASAEPSHAAGVIWLRTQQAEAPNAANLHPTLTTYRNHAYILSLRDNGAGTTNTYFTSNETGHWKTVMLSSGGPPAVYSGEFAAIAIDPSTTRIYATWIYPKTAQTMAIGVWTRDAARHWSGPIDLATAGALTGEPAIAAGNGKVYVAFTATPALAIAPCDERNARAADVFVVTGGATGWGLPQNTTSCVAPSQVASFENPKLALDENGGVFMVAHAANQKMNDLWFSAGAGGSWSPAAQIVSSGHSEDYAGSPGLRTLYAAAASRGVLYVLYTSGAKGGTVSLMSRSPAGAWAGPIRVSPQDSEGCPEFGLSLTARAGRIGAAFIRAAGGYCAVGNGTNQYHTPFLLVGTPAHLYRVALGLPGSASCADTAQSSDGDLFRIALNCGQGLLGLNGAFYYKREFLDVVGPKARLTTRSAGHTIALTWTARDPTPGSGVATYVLQVREGTHWRTVLTSAHGKSLTYSAVQARRQYTFRLRARDRVNNWGRWVSATAHTR